MLLFLIGVLAHNEPFGREQSTMPILIPRPTMLNSQHYESDPYTPSACAGAIYGDVLEGFTQELAP